MILKIRVSPKSSRNRIKKENDMLKVYLTQRAHDGLANKQLVKSLSDYLQIPQYKISIVKGHKSKDKIIEINA
ncbi:MAG: DUF167 domain-containing protein [Candidatus Omnitrophica bacterium]|nr:DUF167 domain-containing protein [Candidatus Omnitrophota bacterium]MBU1091159.1 DUF167 domain-containing protein [Candidatus Omnitrophota bacterium]MBU1905725.1 DUF167 domain-containing protein [Candidatus Omnitrophota bacterium]